MRELVQDAIEDTLEGVLAWHPERVTLDKHLFDAIRSRTRHDYVQAQRFPHQSFDAASASPALMADVESSLTGETGATASAEVTSAAERALSGVRSLAANDADVMRLLDAYVQEALKKVDVGVYDTIKLAGGTKWKGGVDGLYNAKNNGIGYGKVSSAAPKRAALVALLNKWTKQLASGKVKPPSTVK